MDEKDFEQRLTALEALEEQLQRRVGDLDALVEGFHARIDGILARMVEAADKVASLADTLEQVGHAVRGPIDSD